jgi:hypothetical protein
MLDNLETPGFETAPVSDEEIRLAALSLALEFCGPKTPMNTAANAVFDAKVFEAYLRGK